MNKIQHKFHLAIFHSLVLFTVFIFCSPALTGPLGVFRKSDALRVIYTQIVLCYGILTQARCARINISESCNLRIHSASGGNIPGAV